MQIALEGEATITMEVADAMMEAVERESCRGRRVQPLPLYRAPSPRSSKNGESTVADVFYLGGSSDASKHRGDPRRRRFQDEQAEIYEILTWGRKPAPVQRATPPLAPPATTTVPTRTLPNRWVTEKMDQFDHQSTIVVLSPSRKSRHKSEAIIDLETLVGRENAQKMAPSKEEQVAGGAPTAVDEQGDGLAGPAPTAEAGSPAPSSPDKKKKKKKVGSTPSSVNRMALNKRKVVQKYMGPHAEKASSRDLSNTAFSKAFHRPIFGPYGSGNIQPAIGGVMYGNYLLSHNVGPEVAPNHPRTKQVFPGAELKALARSQKSIKPVRFDPKLNERMPLEFLSSIEPKYAALSEYINKGKEKRRAAASLTGSPTRGGKDAETLLGGDDYVLINIEDVPPVSSKELLLPADGDVTTKASHQQQGAPTAGGELVVEGGNMRCPSPPPRKRGVKPPPPPPEDMTPLPGYLKNNPKVYKLLPRNWSSAIPPAGVTIKRGESVKDCLRLFA